MSDDQESKTRRPSVSQTGSREGAGSDAAEAGKYDGTTLESGERDGASAEIGGHDEATVQPGRYERATAESGEHNGATAEVKADGRRARGQRRRTAIIEAALRVVERDGASGLSHRAIAREAGVPASSAVYYFASMDDLLIAALAAGAEDYAEQFRRFADADQVTEGISAMIAESGDTGRERALAEYELVLLAVRRPALRPLARRWMELLTEIARGLTDDPVAVRAFVAAADGLCMESLLHDEGITAAEVHAVLRHILRPSR